MRGKRLSVSSRCNLNGITPARAGKTRSTLRVNPVSEDHPRACGENEDRCSQSRSKQGSPPRVRGKLHSKKQMNIEVRITPARAGKTGSGSRRYWRPEDHPRACGENAASLQPSSVTLGSPPRVRGKPKGFPPVPGQVRITPARAGKTACEPFRRQSPRDHPRACGENSCSVIQRYLVPGSPPRVRGKPLTPTTQH